jgi:3-oxoacyl-[acyl-carrier protein] reductase
MADAITKKYLITGASSDIGLELIKRLISAGSPADEYLLFGNGDTAPLIELCKQATCKTYVYDVDLTSQDGVNKLIETTKEVLACPTHFVHLPALRVINTNFKKFNSQRLLLDMQLQVICPAEICKAFLPIMAKQKYGKVLFMLTNYIIGTPPKNTAAYVTAKQALYGLAKSLAADYAPYGITVNTIAPSMMETKFLDDTSELIVAAAAEAHPQKRNATPADVAPAMQFLLSDDANFITGVMLPITGGA